MRIFIPIIIFLLITAVISCSNNEIILQPGPEMGKDTYVRSWPWYIHFNYGDEDRLFILWKHITYEDFAWCYLEFIELEPYTGSNYQCIKATLSLFWYGGSSAPTPWLLVYRAAGPWEEDTITWDNQPDHAGDPCTYMGPIPQSPQWVDIDVTEIISGWFSGEYEHHGFVIKLVDTTSVCYESFYSSDNYHDEKPKLYVEYRCVNTNL